MWEGWYDWVSSWAVFAIVKVLIWDFLPLSETLILWPPDVTNWLIGKDPDAGKGWKQKEKGTIEDEMADGITEAMDMGLGGLRELVIDR